MIARAGGHRHMFLTIAIFTASCWCRASDRHHAGDAADSATQRTIGAAHVPCLSGPAPGAAVAQDGIAEHHQAAAAERKCPGCDSSCKACSLAQRIQLLISQAESSWSVGGGAGGCAAAGRGGIRASAITNCPARSSRWCRRVVFAVIAVSVAALSARASAEELQSPFARGDRPDGTRAARRTFRDCRHRDYWAKRSPEPVRSEFREVYRQQNFGLPTREALVQLGHRVPLPELNFVITAMLLQKETGGNLVEVLEPHRCSHSRAAAHPGRDTDLHRAGPHDRLDPVAAAGRDVLSDEPGEPLL